MALNSEDSIQLTNIPDFYCHDKKHAIAVDGKIHQNKSDKDEFRDKYIKC
jgi:very-short-patch-repair endonuclease